VYSLVRFVPPTPPSPASAAVVAAFDVDGTLTTRDCVTPFLRHVVGRRLATTLLGHPVAVAEALLRRDRDRLKEIACSALRGLDAEQVDRLGASFAQEVASDLRRDDTTARLRRHRELGHTIVLASASLDPYLVPLGELLGVDAVVCTRLERGSDGLLTGGLVGGNCRGPEKARRVRGWLDGSGLAEAELWAYGDSPGDTELLAAADHPVRVDGVRIEAEPR
jgi:phosphatidylglycerophosphatase C